MIARLDVQMRNKDMGLELTTAAKALLAKKGYDPVLGARPLRRTIQREIEDALSEKILFGELTPGQIVVVDAEPEDPMVKDGRRSSPSAARPRPTCSFPTSRPPRPSPRSRPLDLAAPLLDWYVRAARDLPWRRPGTTPWAVLVSEIMLQQTPVARVIPIYQAWLQRWPDAAALAGDSPGEAVRMWGQARVTRAVRCRQHECARAVRTAVLSGELPADVEELRRRAARVAADTASSGRRVRVRSSGIRWSRRMCAECHGARCARQRLGGSRLHRGRVITRRCRGVACRRTRSARATRRRVRATLARSPNANAPPHAPSIPDAGTLQPVDVGGYARRRRSRSHVAQRLAGARAPGSRACPTSARAARRRRRGQPRSQLDQAGTTGSTASAHRRLLADDLAHQHGPRPLRPAPPGHFARPPSYQRNGSAGASAAIGPHS